jgi:tRNA pseudouridine55 synthase
MTCMDGVLIIDKPAGLTSHDVVARVRRILRERRIGHTGTLDPFATGVLVILVGRATRLAQFLSGAEKEYEAMIRLGFATDTGDLTGTRIAVAESAGARSWSQAELASAMAPLRGEIDQVPPMYSAKKHQGQKLYEMARRGEEIERESVRVTIAAFEALPGAGSLLTPSEDGSCDLAVRVVCSAGTYVRTLAEDFGKRLGVGAHLSALRRTRAGMFAITEGVTLEQLQEKAAAGELASLLVSADDALPQLPFLHMALDDVRRVRNGMEVRIVNGLARDWPDEQQVRMRGENGQLVAIGVFAKATCRLQPRVVIDVEK